ncbi:MAG: glycosyltransferase family 2 protein [Elusimicrobiota bacterium]
MTMLNVNIIIPALNEEEAIQKVLEEIPKNLVKKIIVVDNASTDRTAEKANALGATVVSQNKRGYGRSVLKGLESLDEDCDTVVILDGDHSDFPEDLERLLEPIEKEGADLVIGSRTKNASPGSLMPVQRFGNWLTCALLKIFYGQGFTDMGPFRAMKRSSLSKWKMEDPTFGWNVEMQIKALKHKMKIIEVPVRYRPRIGESKISGSVKGSIKAGTKILWSLWKYS